MPMNADDVQAFVARCLTCPGFLSTTQGHIGNAPSMSPAFSSKQLEQIGLFQAFIVKVKHNGIRDVLPLTFRMLPALGEEMAFYRSYADEYLAIRADGPLSIPHQVSLFAEHLTRYLDGRSSRQSAALRDMLSHELAIWELHETMPVRELPRPAGALLWRGQMTVQHFASDVSRACALLKSNTFDPTRDRAACDQFIAYWRLWDGKAVEFFEIDELTAMLFLMVDGTRTIDAAAKELLDRGADQITSTDLVSFYGELVERGFMEPFHLANTVPAS